MEEIKPIDIIQLDKNNRCISANCVYMPEDITIEYEFEIDEERMNFFANITDYIYQDGKFVLDELPEPDPELTELDKLKMRQEVTEQALQDLILMTMGGEL